MLCPKVSTALRSPLHQRQALSYTAMSAPISAEADPLTFRASKTAGSADDHVRLGTIAFGERPAFPTPHYLALTSRGCVPHMTPDMMQDHTAIRGVYAAFEDCTCLPPCCSRRPPACPACPIPRRSSAAATP